MTLTRARTSLSSRAEDSCAPHHNGTTGTTQYCLYLSCFFPAVMLLAFCSACLQIRLPTTPCSACQQLVLFESVFELCIRASSLSFCQGINVYPNEPGLQVQ